MSPSTVNQDAETSTSPVARVFSKREEAVEPPQDLEESQEQNWLTIRRRCELCKQRKVCARRQNHLVALVFLYTSVRQLSLTWTEGLRGIAQVAKAQKYSTLPL